MKIIEKSIQIKENEEKSNKIIKFKEKQRKNNKNQRKIYKNQRKSKKNQEKTIKINKNK